MSKAQLAKLASEIVDIVDEFEALGTTEAEMMKQKILQKLIEYDTLWQSGPSNW